MLKMDLQVQKGVVMETWTAKGEATRRRIIEGAALEMRERGVALTTLDDVRLRTGTSKGQLFHYFPDGREQLLLAVAQHEADRVIADQQPHLSKLTSWAAWQAWRDDVVARYRGQGQQCPLSVLITQIGRNTPGAQAVTTQLLSRWQGDIATGIREMQGRRKIGSGLDVEQTAAALLAGIQGGVMVMLTTGSLTHLEAALDVGIAQLRTHTP
jgi:AcrR family transcriptional regulator